MTRPILDSDIRPTLMLRKRIGVFLTGDADYRPAGQFVMKFDDNRTTIVEAVIDNVPEVSDVRILDSLEISDKLLVVMEGTDRQEHALFNGLITDIKYDRKTTTIKVTARDRSFVGSSTIVNDILHQKFVDGFETTLDEVNGVYTATLPADTDLAAPIVVQNRVAYGNPLRTTMNNKTALDMDVVYATPITDRIFRTVDSSHAAIFDSKDGAKKYLSQTFVVKRDTQITNLFFPIAQYARLYDGETPPSGNWNFIGIDRIQNIIELPDSTEVNTSTHSMPHTRLGPDNKLRVSLVKCVRSSSNSDLADRNTVTKGKDDVESRTFVPTSGAPGDEHESYVLGSFHSDSTLTLQKDATEVLATIEISPTDPIPAPHYPAGEVPKMTHKFGIMHDDSAIPEEAYTMFGWNLESTPINVENGDTLALIFEMLGDEDHPVLTDGVEPTDKTNPGSYLTPSAMWAVGIGRRLQGTSIEGSNVYPEGDILINALTTRDAQNVRTYVGTHGMDAYKSISDSERLSPGYNGNSDAGAWEYNDKINPNALGDWSQQFANMIGDINALANHVTDPLDIYADGNISNPGALPLTSERYAGRMDEISMYFTAVTGSWLRLGRGLYWDIDESGKVNFQYGSVSWTPFSTNRFGLNMARMSVFENPATGGLINPNGKSSVYDVVNAIIDKIPDWDELVVDGALDGVDDILNTGFNDPVQYPLSYWTMHEESAWNSIQRLATEYDAVIRVHTDINNLSTVLFEKKKQVEDFDYANPADHEYTISTKNSHPNWMKYLVDSRIERDVEQMYTKFRVIGSQDTCVTETHYSLGLPVGQNQPIIFELGVPENEDKLGFEKVKEFKSETNVKTHQQALDVANAAKLLYGNDTFSGTIELAGLHPLRQHPTLGLMVDTNAILKLIDGGSPSGDSESGIDNVYQITGISYNSREHKTDVEISTSIINREVKAAKSLIDNLNKKTSSEESTHFSRLAHHLFYQQAITIPNDYNIGSVQVMLDSAEGGGGTLSEQVQASLLLDQGMEKVAGSTGHIIAIFYPGSATIENDLKPWQFGEVSYSTPSSVLSGNAEPPFYFTMDKAYKYSTDTLTVIIPVTLT